jgi:hypothetical protein
MSQLNALATNGTATPVAKPAAQRVGEQMAAAGAAAITGERP